MIYKLKLQTQDRVSGSSSSANIPIKSSITNTRDLLYGQLEFTSPILLSNAMPVFISSTSINQEASYDSQTISDNQIIGIVPLSQVVGNAYIYQAVSTDNGRFTVSNPSALQSSIINLSVVDGEGAPIGNVGDYTAMFTFFDA